MDCVKLLVRVRRRMVGSGEAVVVGGAAVATAAVGVGAAMTALGD